MASMALWVYVQFCSSAAQSTCGLLMCLTSSSVVFAFQGSSQCGVYQMQHLQTLNVSLQLQESPFNTSEQCLLWCSSPKHHVFCVTSLPLQKFVQFLNPLEK